MSYASASHQHRTAVRDLARIQIRTPTIVQFVASYSHTQLLPRGMCELKQQSSDMWNLQQHGITPFQI
ncbi:hypothetical protein N7504_003467 [Penicillium tannophilum]|nr:hypothetical protein N7504_003467 [Penicillium tannophilum]